MRAAVIFLLFIAVLTASAKQDVSPRIFGGTVTTINQYPFAISLQALMSGSFLHQCGGSIINNRSILTAAHCFLSEPQTANWRGLVGSSFHQSGGTLHTFSQMIPHPNYIPPAVNVDIAILRINGIFNWIPNTVQAASIAGPNYNLFDNQPVWAIGWGLTEFGGLSNQLRHVQLWTINQQLCNQRWSSVDINNSMMCTGRLDVSGFGTCSADSGGPILHNNVVVGVTSFGSGICGSNYWPNVNARVPFVSNWVINNA